MGFGKKKNLPKGMKASSGSLAVSKWSPLWFLLPSLIVISSVIVFPLMFEVMISFKNVNLKNIKQLGQPEWIKNKDWVGFGNYIDTFKVDRPYFYMIGDEGLTLKDATTAPAVDDANKTDEDGEKEQTTAVKKTNVKADEKPVETVKNDDLQEEDKVGSFTKVKTDFYIFDTSDKEAWESKTGKYPFNVPVQGEFVAVNSLWSDVWHNPFWRSFMNTFIWTIVNVFFHVSLGILMGVILNRRLPLKPFLRVLLILPWAVPQYIVALTWKGMFNYEYGAVNVVIAKIFGTGHAISWLSDPSWTFIAAIITNVWLGVPFMMMTTLGGLQSIPQDLYEAADVDGVSGWKKFWYITLPLLKPIMLPATVLGTIWTFNMINIIYIMTSGSGSEESQILVSLVYKKAFEYFRYGYAAAMSIIIFFILFTFSSILTRSQKKMEE